MGRRVVRPGSFLTVTLIATVVAVLGPIPTSEAMVYSSQYWQAEGTVESVPTLPPTVSGATGSFVLGALSNQNIPQGSQDSQGQVTVYEQSTTRYYKGDANGNYTASTADKVVTPTARVFVNGRYYQENGQIELFANFVWSPPPPPTPPSSTPPNPKPNLPRDLVIQRLFGVTAKVTEPGTGIEGGTLWSPFFGFTLGNFTDYGCGLATTCHVEAIALAHSGHLRIYETPFTTFWLQGADGGYTRNTVQNRSAYRFQVINQIGAQQGVFVNGRYEWDGVDWRFLASNVFGPPPTATASTPTTSTVTASSIAVKTDGGTPDPSGQTWLGTQYSGNQTPTGPLGSGRLTLQNITWQVRCGPNESPGSCTGPWEFSGSYQIANGTGASGFSGSIYGTVTRGTAVGTIDAQLSVDNATGQWAGWSGAGTFRGSPPDGAVMNGGIPLGNVPPDTLSGSFVFQVVPPATS